jgi:nucleoredoxin
MATMARGWRRRQERSKTFAGESKRGNNHLMKEIVVGFVAFSFLVIAGCSKEGVSTPQANTKSQDSGGFFDSISKRLVTAEGGKFSAGYKGVINPKYTAIYYSAHWCPPCRAFTPELVKWYNGFQPKHKDFQLVFVSSDKDEAAMLGYMTEMKMPWPALKFGEKKETAVTKYAASGIPYLVLIDENGKDLTGEKDNEWQPPQGILKKIEEIVGAKK